ncbi:DUF3307 domain-containing protein [Winogradskyella sp. F6397]|uniref:DUF3307 domain-containing protein n=1 Tax=Winogradskyella marina TaxID=2785530 RepID=A0ABS0EFV7_9FLAO|nr:DUF3307 domain-containing protein [Winogradskyella marina]MBF8149323.1 DUF3307 domain-containing protein [Winogradskyella marina]
MTVIILKLILAHLIGDFFLQPKSWVKDKEKKKLKSIWLYVHVAVHVALMFLVVWDLSYTPLILGIALLHLIIDALKLILHRKKTKRLFFFIDQLLHLITIIGLTAILYADAIDMTLILDTNLLTLLICVAFLTKPTSIIMKVIFSKWNISKLTKDNESLKDAGNYIGVLERLLVFIFIITDHWEAVGFLITAKSVFRFGDLTASKERKLTEYILIGTLISFGIAILTSLLYLNLINYV